MYIYETKVNDYINIMYYTAFAEKMQLNVTKNSSIAAHSFRYTGASVARCTHRCWLRRMLFVVIYTSHRTTFARAIHISVVTCRGNRLCDCWACSFISSSELRSHGEHDIVLVHGCKIIYKTYYYTLKWKLWLLLKLI